MTENRDILSDLEFDQTAKAHLRGAANWARIIAIIAFVSYAVNLIVAFTGRSAATLDESGSLGFGAARGSQIAGTLVTVIIGVIISLFLFRFANNAREAVDKLSQSSLETSFNALSIYFKIIGVLIIIFLVFAVLALLLARGAYA